MGLLAERTKRTKWFLEDRFGMFIHWGLYAIPARGEWVMLNERIPKEAYRTYFEEFDPINYDPREWARVAKQAGMKYAVMTASIMMAFASLTVSLLTTKLPTRNNVVT